MAKSLLLIRHGQISANRDGRWHGSTDSQLTWRGKRQARRTSAHLGTHGPPIHAIYSSPLQRCLQTASAVSAALDVEVQIEQGLREYAIGEWEDMPFKELIATHDFIARATENPNFEPPGGESLNTVATRIVEGLRRINEAHAPDQTVLVVSHGAAMAVALGVLLDGDPGKWVEYQFGNCALTELIMGTDAYVNSYNDTQHL